MKRTNNLSIKYSVPTFPDFIECALCGKKAIIHTLYDKTFDYQGTFTNIEQMAKYLCLCELEQREDVMIGDME